MLTLYYVFIILGMLLLLFSLFGGEGDIDGFDVDVDVDTDLDSTSVFSLRTIAAGLLSYGGGSLIMYENGFSLIPQIIVGIIAGFAMIYFVYLITKFLYSQQGSSSISLSGVIGKTGIIIVGTTVNGTAQLKVDTLNGPQQFLCKEVNAGKLKVSDNVTINSQIGNLLIVEK